MYRNRKFRDSVDSETLVPVALAAHLLGSDFHSWLAGELGITWTIYNFGWGDFDQPFLVPIDVRLGGL